MHDKARCVATNLIRDHVEFVSNNKEIRTPVSISTQRACHATTYAYVRTENQLDTQYMACAARNMHEHATYVAMYQVFNGRACKACKIIEMSHGMYGMAQGMQYV
jgi:hypothetical protein